MPNGGTPNDAAGARPRTLLVPLGAGDRAELRGDWTAWRAVPLARAADGRWAARVALAPGVYAVSVRLDGGAWRPPPGLPAAADGFGGEVGLLVVER